MSDLIKKWKLTGLLDNLQPLYVNMVAEYLDRCYQKIQKTSSVKMDKHWNGIVFPIIRILFDKSGKEMDYDIMFQLYNQKYKLKFETTNNKNFENKIIHEMVDEYCSFGV